MTRWATSLQAAVAAIRKAGATTQTILLPGNYVSAYPCSHTNTTKAMTTPALMPLQHALDLSSRK